MAGKNSKDLAVKSNIKYFVYITGLGKMQILIATSLYMEKIIMCFVWILKKLRNMFYNDTENYKMFLTNILIWLCIAS